MKLTDIGFLWKFYWILDKRTLVGFWILFGLSVYQSTSESKLTYAHINNNSLFA